MPNVYLRGLWKNMSEKGRRTLPWDLLRGAFEGAAFSCVGTFTLLVAIQHFDCSDNLKALIASGIFAGMALSFLYATYSHYLIGRRNIETALPIFLSAGCLIACSRTSDPVSYAWLAFLAAFLFTLKFPLMTALYRENYKRIVRGQVVAFGLLSVACSNTLLTFLGGRYLDTGIEKYRSLFLVFGILVAFAGVALLKIPSHKATRVERPHPFSYFGILKRDKVFVYILFVWFLFGLANITLLPQRFEYVTQEQYGFSLSPLWVALIVGVIPEIVRIALIIPMGWFFDRTNFILFRIGINLFFFAYMLVYFHATTLPALALGMLLLGISFAGGSISWNLWVTKYASPDETAQYMAMHTFFNGVRGVIGPYCGYLIAANHSIPTLANIGAGLMLLSSLLLFPLVRQGAPNDYRKGEGTEPEV